MKFQTSSPSVAETSVLLWKVAISTAVLVVPQPQTTTEQPKAEVLKKASSGPGEWTEVVKREANVATPPLQQDVPEKGATKQQQAKQQQPWPQ